MGTDELWITLKLSLNASKKELLSFVLPVVVAVVAAPDPPVVASVAAKSSKSANASSAVCESWFGLELEWYEVPEWCDGAGLEFKLKASNCCSRSLFSGVAALGLMLLLFTMLLRVLAADPISSV